MNQTVPVPGNPPSDASKVEKLPPKPPARVKSTRADQEFLPAALEILERPPSPAGMAIMGAIGLLAVLAVIWSYFGRIDVIATAQGKIQPTGRVKVIQPLETGKVVALNVQNGQHVAAGAVLAELDAAEAAADEASYAAGLSSYRAEIARRRTAIAKVEAGDITSTRIIDWSQADPGRSIPALIRQREERNLAGDLGQLSGAIGSLAAQLNAKKLEQASLSDTIASQARLIAILQERVNIRSDLVDKQSGTKSAVLDARESLMTQQTNLFVQKGQLSTAVGAAKVLESDIGKTRDTFVAENSQKLADAERQADDLQQKLAKARSRLQHMSLSSPISGTVQALTLTTIGQVVTTSEELMRVVPDGGDIEIEAYLPNKDIGFVKTGQEAVIKVESFPFTRYGTITAKVIRVATDAIPEPDAVQTEGGPSRQQRPGAFAGAQRTQNLVFPITLQLSQAQIMADGVMVNLSPGMAVSVEVQTGRRRILEYLFSPLVEVSSEAMHER